MSTPIADGRVARLFGLRGESWMRHANPWSVWTRFSVLPLLLTVTGLLFGQCAKAWYIDRAVLLFEDMTSDARYADGDGEY